MTAIGVGAGVGDGSLATGVDDCSCATGVGVEICVEVAAGAGVGDGSFVAGVDDCSRAVGVGVENSTSTHAEAPKMNVSNRSPTLTFRDMGIPLRLD